MHDGGGGMSVTPRIHLVAYEDRPGAFIFVAVPNERGRYLRTDKSVALVACPVCGAMVGEPCGDGRASEDGYSATTHHRRRSLALARFGRGAVVGDVLHKPETIPDEWMEAAA